MNITDNSRNMRVLMMLSSGLPSVALDIRPHPADGTGDSRAENPAGRNRNLPLPARSVFSGGAAGKEPAHGNPDPVKPDGR